MDDVGELNYTGVGDDGIGIVDILGAVDHDAGDIDLGTCNICH